MQAPSSALVRCCLSSSPVSVPRQRALKPPTTTAHSSPSSCHPVQVTHSRTVFTTIIFLLFHDSLYPFVFATHIQNFKTPHNHLFQGRNQEARTPAISSHRALLSWPAFAPPTRRPICHLTPALPSVTYLSRSSTHTRTDTHSAHGRQHHSRLLYKHRTHSIQNETTTRGSVARLASIATGSPITARSAIVSSVSQTTVLRPTYDHCISHSSFSTHHPSSASNLWPADCKLIARHPA